MKTRSRAVSGAIMVITFSLVAAMPQESRATERLERRASISSLLKEVQQELAVGQYDSVLVRLAEVKKLDPNNQDAFYYLALTRLALADTAEAVAVLNEGAQRAPLSSRIKLLLTRIYLGAGRYDEAESLLETILRFKPHDAETLYLRGLTSLARGDTSLALESWQKALENLEAKGKWGR